MTCIHARLSRFGCARVAGWLFAGLLLSAALAGCERQRPTSATHVAAAPQPARTPEQAVLLPTRLLRQNDLAGFALATVPATLHAPLQAAWREGRTRWPLDELPFDQRLPQLMQALSAADAQPRLQRGFERQFAGADAELAAAARALGLFGLQYLQREGDFSPAERAHYAQLVQAISAWARTAKLGERERGVAAIARLTAAARATGLASEADFRRRGMHDSLQALGPFVAAGKQVLSGYGLDIDAALDGMHASVEARDGDSATVRMRYRLGGHAIDASVPVQRIDGHWYVRDFVRHARAATAPAAAPSA